MSATLAVAVVLVLFAVVDVVVVSRLGERLCTASRSAAMVSERVVDFMIEPADRRRVGLSVMLVTHRMVNEETGDIERGGKIKRVNEETGDVERGGKAKQNKEKTNEDPMFTTQNSSGCGLVSCDLPNNNSKNNNSNNNNSNNNRKLRHT